MKAIHFCYILTLFCFHTLVLAANGPNKDPEYDPAWGPAFDTNLCPLYYLRETGNSTHTSIELVATCSNGGNTSQYRTSSLNLDQCLFNEEGDLFPSEPNDWYSGPFSKTCLNCGLAYLSVEGSTEGVYLRCSCLRGLGDDRTPNLTGFHLGRSIHVKNDTLGCFEFNGQIIGNPIPYVNVTSPTASVVTVTTTATIFANITISPTSSPTSFTNSSSILPSTVTVTKTHEKTKEPVTVTTTETIASPVTILVSIKVTETPTPTPRISAILYTTVQASFVTLNSSSAGLEV
ncbi:hypothetical protein F4805DRAFT_457604 [Annulohypoxylon moriforme]|nr:hypothetical protein F4805DRAFT_457604 [Annulohypoxylon moriforme]